MREIVHLQAGQCGNQIGAKVILLLIIILYVMAVFCEEQRLFKLTN